MYGGQAWVLPEALSDRSERGTGEERMARECEVAAACPVKMLTAYTPVTRQANAIALLTEQLASHMATIRL